MNVLRNDERDWKHNNNNKEWMGIDMIIIMKKKKKNQQQQGMKMPLSILEESNIIIIASRILIRIVVMDIIS
jgi:hypothetical protein